MKRIILTLLLASPLLVSSSPVKATFHACPTAYTSHTIDLQNLIRGYNSRFANHVFSENKLDWRYDSPLSKDEFLSQAPKIVTAVITPQGVISGRCTYDVEFYLQKDKNAPKTPFAHRSLYYVPTNKKCTPVAGAKGGFNC